MKNQSMANNSLIHFNSNHFDYNTGRLLKDNGEEVFMEHRLKELFFILLKNKNHIVRRETLMSFVWKDVIVSDESITKAISDLRKFIQQEGLDQIKIRTIRKLGYRLEIDESLSQVQKKKSWPLIIFKSLLYIIIALMVMVILIRAINYE